MLHKLFPNSTEFIYLILFMVIMGFFRSLIIIIFAYYFPLPFISLYIGCYLTLTHYHLLVFSLIFLIAQISNTTSYKIFCRGLIVHIYLLFAFFICAHFLICEQTRLSYMLNLLEFLQASKPYDIIIFVFTNMFILKSPIELCYSNILFKPIFCCK